MELERLSMHEAYKRFCSKHPLKKLAMPKSDLVWCYYDINSRNDNIVIFLHGICGTAGCYFYQLDALANLGFRVISFQYPCYNYLKDWIKNMCNILEYLNIKKAHFFASDLGGFLIQLYAKLYPSKIESLILCNSYRKTDDFAAIASLRNIYGKLYSFLPHVLLKKIILENYIYSNYVNIDLKEKNSLEFMSNEIDLIPASDLGGRISLQLSSETVDRIYISDKSITILQTLNNMYSDSLNEDMRKAYPFAKHAIMKSGGDFPYLSRYEEVNLYILVHLRNNCNTAFVKEQINNMSYIHQQKNEDDNYEKKSANIRYNITNYSTNENNHNNKNSNYDITNDEYNFNKNVNTYIYKENNRNATHKYQTICSNNNYNENNNYNYSNSGNNNNNYNNSSNNNYQKQSKIESHEIRKYNKHENYINNNSTYENNYNEESTKFYKNNANNAYIKGNCYEEQNENYSNKNDCITDNYNLYDTSNSFNKNYNDDYMNNKDIYKNSTGTYSYNNIKNKYNYIDINNKYNYNDINNEYNYNDINNEYNYNDINNEYNYNDINNENFNRSNQSISNSDEIYNSNHPVNYKNTFQSNDPTPDHANISKNDIFCHF